MMTDTKVKQAKPKEKPYKLGDRNGLHLYVTTSGHPSWRYKYRIAGKERRIVFGTYPEMSLVDARERLDETRKQIRDGGDPQVIAARAKLVGGTSSSKNFEAVARDWHQQQIDRWKPVRADDVITSMEKDLFPDLGSWPVDQIDIPMLLAVLRKVEARGAIETAHRLRQRAQAVFRYARGIGINNINPAADIGTALKLVPKKRRWPALKEQSQICALMVCVDQAGASPVTRLASRFLALTAQRPGMVRHAEWREFENIDWSNEQADISRALRTNFRTSLHRPSLSTLRSEIGTTIAASNIAKMWGEISAYDEPPGRAPATLMQVPVLGEGPGSAQRIGLARLQPSD